MLGYNLVLLGCIFNCILTLMPFPFCFVRKILILTLSQLGDGNFVDLKWGLGGFWS